jgi:hypothetical protein
MLRRRRNTKKIRRLARLLVELDGARAAPVVRRPPRHLLGRTT